MYKDILKTMTDDLIRLKYHYLDCLNDGQFGKKTYAYYETKINDEIKSRSQK